jgi:trehalose 6-phosphate synthase/phosphatase
VEEKLGGLAWHYRKADPEFGPMQAHELRLQLGELIKNASAAILSGSAVVEVRALGVNKGWWCPPCSRPTPAR